MMGVNLELHEKTRARPVPGSRWVRPTTIVLRHRSPGTARAARRRPLAASAAGLRSRTAAPTSARNLTGTRSGLTGPSASATESSAAATASKGPCVACQYRAPDATVRRPYRQGPAMRLDRWRPRLAAPRGPGFAGRVRSCLDRPPPALPPGPPPQWVPATPRRKTGNERAANHPAAAARGIVRPMYVPAHCSCGLSISPSARSPCTQGVRAQCQHTAGSPNRTSNRAPWHAILDRAWASPALNRGTARSTMPAACAAARQPLDSSPRPLRSHPARAARRRMPP